MPRKDAHHDVVRRALEKDGWRITHEPLTIKYEEVTLFADLRAERISAIDNETNKVVVEIKVFGEKVLMSEFERAVGQYSLYRFFLDKIKVETPVFLAVTESVYEDFFEGEGISEFTAELKMNILVFEPKEEVILRWINWQNTET